MKKVFFTTTAILASVSAFAQESIKAIEIIGNKRIQDAVIQSYISYTEGMTYNKNINTKIVKRLYSTGLFSDVKVDWYPETKQLVVNVLENPVVNKIAFEENEEIADSILEKVISLRSRSVFTNQKIQSDVDAIKKAYRSKGFFLVEIQPEYIKRSQNRIDVIYKIKEGPKTLVQKINFTGNKAISTPELFEIVSTKESAWYKFFSTKDAYDPDRVEFDKELLRRFYLQKGYADFSMEDPVVELKQDKTGFIVNYTLSEGKKYFFGDIDVKVDDPDLDLNLPKLNSLVYIKKNEVYNTKDIEDTIDRLVEELSNQGYAFVEVVPLINKNQEARQINLTFDLRPGARIYVNRINIEGNTRTRDNVIRRQMRLSEGDALQANKLTRSKDRLTYLDYFSKVDITPEQTDFPDKVDLNVTIEEQNTGEFNIGAGLSSYEGLLATLDLTEHNFLGKGQQLRFGFSLSSKRRDFNIGFTEPWFLGRELLAGFDIYNRETSYEDESSYDEQVLGVAGSLGFPVDEFTKNTIRLKVEDKEVTGVDNDSSVFIQELEGSRNKIALSNTVSRDTRDNRFAPTKGYNTSWSVEYSGFGSDISYIKNTIKGSYNYLIKEDYVLTVAGRTGYLWDINDETPITENFRAGGSTLRGFAPSGVGPRDGSTDDALGGKFMIGHNVELRYPLPGLKDSGVNGLFFWDGGTVTSLDDPYGVVQEDNVYRQSLGTGIFWRSPLGPLRVEFGLPIVKGENDETEVFSFSFGTRF